MCSVFLLFCLSPASYFKEAGLLAPNVRVATTGEALGFLLCCRTYHNFRSQMNLPALKPEGPLGELQEIFLSWSRLLNLASPPFALFPCHQ
jgi:hypothetical protein